MKKIGALKVNADELAYWLQVAGRSEPMRAAHFFVQLKHALFGTPEEKAECWRWLKGDRSFVPKFSYVRQSAVRVVELKNKIYDLSNVISKTQALQYHTSSCEQFNDKVSAEEEAIELAEDIRLFGNCVAQYANDTVIVLPELVAWNIPLFQRPQQMAMSFAELGIMFIFVTPNGNDNVHVIKRITDNCFLIPVERYEQVMMILRNHGLKIVLDICSTDNQHFMPWIQRQMDEKCKILYEYIDEISDDITGEVPKDTYERHNALLKDENVFIVATADKLFEEVLNVRGSGKNCLNSGNGVDLKHFRVERDLSKSPAAIRSIIHKRKPIIGYFGAIANWFDFELIEYAAKQRPNYEFLMIGPNYGMHELSYLDELKKIRNLHFVGTVQYQKLPYVASYFTVAIIPFKLNEITESTSPIKLFEYMAMGKPIVTTAMRECFKYPVIRIAKDAEDFVAALDESIAKSSEEEMLVELARVAEENSWLNKAREIIDLLEIGMS